MTPSRKGIRVPLSPARRIVAELMHHARKVPSLPLKRTLNVAQLAAARDSCVPKPTWVGIFLKAYSLVARERVELRRCFVRWPRPHLYEHPASECAVLVERDWDGEKAVLGAKIRGPENQSLEDIDLAIRRFQSAPFDDVSDLRQLARLGRLPGIARRLVFWSSLWLSGFTRSKRFGTFMISTLGNLGIDQCHPLSPLTTYFSFGPIAADGTVVGTIVYDHRVLDGRTVARALCDLETVLNGPILAEVRAREFSAAAAA